MAAEAAKIQPEPAAPQEAPAAPQEAAAAPVVEDWKKRPFEGGSLRSAENAAEARGLEKLNLEASAEKEKFGEETKSFWGRAKERLFGGKKEPAQVKGETEIMAEIEKSNVAYAEFKQKYDAIMASGDEAQLRGLEQDLSKTFDVLAPKVAEQGAKEADAYKEALATQSMPRMTKMGAMLNDTSRRLQEVRGRLNGAPAPAETANAEAPSAPKAEAAPAPQEAQVQAKPDEAAPSAEDAAAAREKALASDREQLMKAAAGWPGERLVDEYLKVRDLKSDQYGAVVARGLDVRKGEIVLKYEDGSQLRKYADGRAIRVLPGGVKLSEEETARSERIAQMGGRVDAAMAAEDQAEAAATDADEEIFDDAEKAQLAADAAKFAEPKGVVSGEIESSPAAEPVVEAGGVQVDAAYAKDAERASPKTSEQSSVASGEIENSTVLQRTKTSEDAPTASGEIVTEEPKPQPPKPQTPAEKYPDLPKPRPGSMPPGVPDQDSPLPAQETAIETTPDMIIEEADAEAEPVSETDEVPTAQAAAEAPETPEKKESAFDKLEAKLDDAAAEVMKMPEASESPKTFATKVGKLPAEKFLEAFKAVGAISGTEAVDLAAQFKLESEEFDALRKKLAQAVRKKMKG